jgi:hypothetical protein
MNTRNNLGQRAIIYRQSLLCFWMNPLASELRQVPDVVRFTAVLTNRSICLWDYSLACHTDISAYLQLQDTYDSSSFLKGAAAKQPDGKFLMFQSHYLESFKPSRLTQGERLILSSLLGQDWSWVNQYVKVIAWLEAFRKRIGL